MTSTNRNCSRRIAPLACLTFALAALACFPAQAQQSYPSRPVRIVVGFPSGAAGDVTARVVGTHLGQILGQQIVVENKPGASSNIAAEFAARAPKDGYTLFLGTVANVINAAITPNLPFDFSRDFAPIGLAAVMPVILVVHPSLGVGTVPELIALAKSKPEKIFYASTGVATTPNLAAELLNIRAGIKLVHVPYQGSPQAVTDLLSGRVQVMFSPASTVMPHVERGALKALAWAAPERPSIARNLPTMAELGMPDLDASIWFGLMAPAGTPRDVIDTVAHALSTALQSTELVNNLRKQGVEPLSSTPEAFLRYVENETRKWSIAAQAAGVKK
jgi:tripartite-type tricarboxylate transporter receptor subunit TctC